MLGHLLGTQHVLGFNRFTCTVYCVSLQVSSQVVLTSYVFMFFMFTSHVY
jgi:hypothetical protein